MQPPADPFVPVDPCSQCRVLHADEARFLHLGNLDSTWAVGISDKDGSAPCNHAKNIEDVDGVWAGAQDGRTSSRVDDDGEVQADGDGTSEPRFHTLGSMLSVSASSGPGAVLSGAFF